jgi:hypothetical protein
MSAQGTDHAALTEPTDAKAARFTVSITVTPLADGRSWVLYSPDFAFMPEEGEEVAVPAGFITDFASVPRPLWWLFAPWGRHGHAAVIHDWGYYKQDRTRREYDRIFLDAMRTLGVGRLKRYAMWLAVRGPGWFAWRANKRRSLADPGWKLTTGRVPAPADVRALATTQHGVVNMTEALGRRPR